MTLRVFDFFHFVENKEEHFMAYDVTKKHDPALFLAGKSSDEGTALVILNQPIVSSYLLHGLWTSCQRRYCADGGANRLYDALPNETERHKFV